MMHRPKIDPKLAFVAAAVVAALAIALVRGRLQPAAPAFTAQETRRGAGVTETRPFSGVRSGPGPTDAGAVVYVTGAVLHGGVYRLPATARIDDAIRRAGGPDGTADLEAINLAQPLHDGDMVLVPRRGSEADLARVATLDEGPANAASTGHRHAHRKRSHRRRADVSSAGAESPDLSAEPAADAPPELAHHRRHHRHRSESDESSVAAVDLNGASEEQLESIPGIGPELASRIVEFRELNGPFASSDELLDVSGITDSKLVEIAPYLVVK